MNMAYFSDEKMKVDPEVRARIKKQIEYYFGDYNLPNDRFLKEQVKLNHGWVRLDTLLKFKRLASLTHDTAVIVDALYDSELIQVSFDNTCVRRNPGKPLPVMDAARRQEIATRTVYIKGFPKEGFTMDDALNFFDPYGPIDEVKLQFWHNKTTSLWNFKGSVLVKFPSREAASAFLRDDVKYRDESLIKMFLEVYIQLQRERKQEEKHSRREGKEK